MSQTMNLHQVPETMALHRALWAGRIMSAFVVIALVADGTIQLFAPAQIASMLQETGFAMDLTRVVGPIILACAILYAIPATSVLGAILVTGFLGGAICAHVRIGELGSPPEIISLLLGANRGSALSLNIRRKHMFLVMGITGKVGGATAEHLLAHGKEVRALVRNREKASSWANRGVELVDGDWNDSAAIKRALKGVEGAFVMLPAVWAPSPDYKEAKGVIANYVEALTKAAPPRVVALSSMGANRTSGLGMITALSLLEQGFRDLISPIAFVRAGGFFENFLYGLQVAQGGTLPVYYNPTNRKSTMVATNDIGAEVATLLTGPAWSGQRVVELGSMVTADEVAEQLGEVLDLDVKAFAVPRAGWAEAFEQIGIPKGHTAPAEEMYEAVNAGWMDLGVEGTEHVAGTTSAHDVFAAAQKAVTA